MDAKIKIKGVPAFIMKLWEIMHNERYVQWVRWTPLEDAFFVVDQQGFCDHVLSKYFRHTNFPSFTRQLNIYNFSKEKNEEGMTIYANFLFKKNRISLLKGMKRKPTKEEIEKAQQMFNNFDIEEDVEVLEGIRFKRNDSKQTNSQSDTDLMKQNKRLRQENTKLLANKTQLEQKIDCIQNKLCKYYSANSDSTFFANLFNSIINHVNYDYIYDLSAYRICLQSQTGINSK